MLINLRVIALVLFVIIALITSLPAQDGVDLSIPRIGKLPQSTQMHGTAVVGQRLYIVGGENQSGWSNLVYSAPIGEQGRLQEWRPETSLPVRLAYMNNSIEVVGNRIYIVGGVTAPERDTREVDTKRSQDVYWTEVAADETLAPWKKSPPFPGPHLAFMATCSTDRLLLVTGGTTRQAVHSTVYAADFSPDGEPRNWRPIGELPIPLGQHGAAIQGERLYVWGGLDSRKNASQITKEPASANARTWSAELREDVTLGPWREEAPMPAPTFLAASSGFNDYLVSIGGRYRDKTPTNSIWYARLEEGRILEWKVARTDLDARVYHSLGLDRMRGRIFVTGGQNKTMAGVQPVSRIDLVQGFEIPQPENARLNTVQVASASPLRPKTSADDGTDSFLQLPQALQTAAQRSKPILAFFYSPQVPDCRRFWDRVIETPAFQSLGGDYVLSAVDISGSDAPLGPRYNIYKVPAFAVIGSDGTRLRSSIAIESMDDVTRLLGSR